jgi:hypothetical protein
LQLKFQEFASSTGIMAHSVSPPVFMTVPLMRANISDQFRGRWKRAGGRGQVEEGRWKRAGGRGQMEAGRWKRADGRGQVEEGR